MSSSFYVLEFSALSGEPARADIYVLASRKQVRKILEGEFLSSSREARAAAATWAVWLAETMAIWVFQSGIVSTLVDLRRLVSVKVDTHPPVRLDDELGLDALVARLEKEGRDPAALDATFAVDFDGLEAALPALVGPTPKKGASVTFQGHLQAAQEMASALAAVRGLPYGHTDLVRGTRDTEGLDEEPLAPSAPAQPSTLVAEAPPPPEPPWPPPSRLITAIDVDGRVALRIPAERFELRAYADLGRRSLDFLHAVDKVNAAQRSAFLERGLFVARLPFLSEVFLDGKPLARPRFEAEAKEEAPGVRALAVHLPRFGPVKLFERGGKRYVVSEPEANARLFEALLAGWADA
jgi:hypothetical protein